MLRDVASVEIVETHPFGVIIDDIELWIFLRQEPDGFAVRPPEWFPRGVNQLFPVFAIHVHHAETADGVPAFSFIERKAYLCSIGRYLRIMLMLLWRLREIHGIGSVGVHDEDLPV